MLTDQEFKTLEEFARAHDAEYRHTMPVTKASLERDLKAFIHDMIPDRDVARILSAFVEVPSAASWTGRAVLTHRKAMLVATFTLTDNMGWSFTDVEVSDGELSLFRPDICLTARQAISNAIYVFFRLENGK